MPEIEKALAELKRLMEYRISCAETDEAREKERNFYGIGLTSRTNLCIHPEVSHFKVCNITVCPREYLAPSETVSNVDALLSHVSRFLGLQGEEREGSGRAMPRPHE